MILIADGGSTKIEWSLLVNRTVVKRMVTRGLNPVMLTREEIVDRLNIDITDELRPWAKHISRVFFYGAGCLPGEISDMMEESIRAVIGPGPSICVSNDLLAAARAVCGDSPGIACILGTGSNSCYYDGEKIVDNVSPLGYVLGDEGSGAVLGRQLIGDLLKRRLPESMTDEFMKKYNLDPAKIIRRVYRDPAPNKFLASLCPFVLEHLGCPDVRRMVKEQFVLFFRRNVDNYRRHDPEGLLTVNFVGSVAYYFRSVLEEAAADCGYVIGKIIQSPMDGLIKYHNS